MLRRSVSVPRAVFALILLIFLSVAWSQGKFSIISSIRWPYTTRLTDYQLQDQLVTNRPLDAALLEKSPAYVQAILNTTDQTFPRLQCPSLKSERYDYLKAQGRLTWTKPRYFFALDLHQNAELLPRLIGSVVETASFLGFENCALSIIEGRSDDGTYEILHTLKQSLEALNFQFFLSSSDINPLQGDRVEGLAKLRNLALQPLLSARNKFEPETTIIFLNDVAICTEDILELLHQRQFQGADMTCALDWTYVGNDPTFYDHWIARGMTGEAFFNIPADGNYNSAWNLFWNDVKSQTAVNNRIPFQVFSCWNGAVTFGANVLDKIRFRRNYEGECYAGEPRLFCKDMWYQGFDKIAVVPSVNLEYSDDAARRIKELKGFTSQNLHDDRIEWDQKPPAMVKCDQDMRPWDESLAENGVFPG